MNPKKLSEYKLNGSIHTLQMMTLDTVEEGMVHPDVAECVDISTRKQKDGTTKSVIKVNPNKLQGDLYTYSSYEEAMDVINGELGLDDPVIVRADMRFDSYDPEHYLKYAKLNRLLISMVAVTYSVKNRYKSEDLFTSQQLSIAIKNQYFELESYDKAAESEGKDYAKSRFEERSKKLSASKNVKEEFTSHWFNRWNKAYEKFEYVQQVYNDSLEKIYFEQRDMMPVQFRSITDFLIHYQYAIFTKNQLIDLLIRITGKDYVQCKKRAENHKARYGIEFFSRNDVKKAIQEIGRATEEFFNS